MKPRGLVVSVDYSDLLGLTLPSNMQHLAECVVVTSPADRATQDLVASIPGARAHVTDAFYRDGAMFNKGRAIEEAFDVLGREGWILIWDADILLPDVMPLEGIAADFLYGAPRRMVEDPMKWDMKKDWREYGLSNDNKRVIGYFQLFHADSPYLKDNRPWYDQTFVHAGGGDGYFEGLTPRDHQKLLPFDVLHLGPRDANWFGRRTPRLDGSVPKRAAELEALMDQFHRWKGWRGYPRSDVPFPEKIVSAEVAQTGHVCR